ncbi:MAG: FAD-dependent oxidoreductase [Chloroflexi bacterium]|nr:FAD-dependent oxidoreductase [Chloroflexota bacterium]
MEDKIIGGIDVLVIGGGIAGVAAAIKAKEAGAKEVVILTKGHVGKGGNSAFGAGVMHVVHPKETDDDKKDRLWRLARAQGFLADQLMLQDHLEDTLSFIPELESYGVEFEKTSSGEIERHAGRGAHPVIMFHGHQMMNSVMKAARKIGVRFINHVMLTDFLTHGNSVVGALGLDYRSGDFYQLEAKAVVLATGSTWYKGIMVGHRDDTGDGYMAAFRAGVTLSGAESNDQISHAMPARFDIGPGLNMYQGLGGKLINAKGERFMEKYIPTLKEKAGLRNLMYAFILEVKQGNGPVYFDFTHFTPNDIDRMRRVIPIPVRMFESAGLLVNNRFIAPVEWMLCPPTGRPGLVVNRDFETSHEGLFACGEAAAVWAVVTGLASAGTSGARAGKNAAKYAKEADEPKPEGDQVRELKNATFAPLERANGIEADQILLATQENIIPYDIVLLQKQDRMERALRNIEYVRDNYQPLVKAYDPHYLRTALEACNMLGVAEIHLRTCLYRKESRVSIREDYPFTDDGNWLKRIEVVKADGDMRISTKDVPISDYPFQVEQKRELHYIFKRAERLEILETSEGQVKWA